MRKEDFLDAIEDKYIAQALEYTPKKARKIRWGIVAAAAALIAVLGVSGAAIAAEAREYGLAEEFFRQNGLPLEGLSRGEVKEVYRDITTESFTSSKTAEVLSRAVPGFEIAQEAPTPRDVEKLWDLFASASVRNNTQGISFKTDYIWRTDKENLIVDLDSSTITLLKDGEELWTARFPYVWTNGAVYLDGGALVWGRTNYYYNDDNRAWVARVDQGGNILWQHYLEHGILREGIAFILDNGDGTWEMVSQGSLSEGSVACMTRIDLEGRELERVTTPLDGFVIRTAVRLGDGYLLGDRQGSIMRMDGTGALSASYTYEGEDCIYYITDMTEFGGRIYLSAYAFPRRSDPGGRDEVADILKYAFGNINDFLASPERADGEQMDLTAQVRDNYTAVLLLCPIQGGTPEAFYSVPGSLGGSLKAGEESLQWEVQSVESAFYSPATSSFSIGGTCRIYRYSFDTEGRLTGSIQTQETAVYRR